MSVPQARVSSVAERWDRERVLALAPDVPSQRTAQSLASGRAWPVTGAAAGADAVWGECRGSASAPYRAVVDLSGPAYRCSCPSRKFPCKHVLALLLLWSEGSVPDDAAGPPDWAGSWLIARAAARGSGGRAPRRGGFRAQGPQGGGPPRGAAREQGRVRPGRARPVAVRPGAAGPRRQPAGRRRPLGRHRRPDDRRASPRPGRASARPGLRPALRDGLGRPAASRSTRCSTCSPSPTAGRASCRRRCGRPSGPGSASASARPTCWPAATRSGITGRCWPGGTSSRTGSGPAGPGCGAARPAGTRCCSASRRRARHSTTPWPSAPTPTRTWCSTPARSRCAPSCWPGTTTAATMRRRRAAGRRHDRRVAGRVRGGALRRSLAGQLARRRGGHAVPRPGPGRPRRGRRRPAAAPGGRRLLAAVRALRRPPGDDGGRVDSARPVAADRLGRSRMGGTAVSTWQDLVTASLMGTERTGVPAAAVPGLPVQAEAVPDDPAALLLDRAALLTVARRGGRPGGRSRPSRSPRPNRTRPSQSARRRAAGWPGCWAASTRTCWPSG